MCIWSEGVYLAICLQVVLKDIDRNGEVSDVEGVRSIPTLRTKLAPPCYHCVEVAEGEPDTLELILLCAGFQ